MRESHTFYRALAVSIAAVSILAWSKPTSAKSISFYELQAGVATFKDVQLPYWGEFFGDPTTRADGSSIQEDNGSHVGFPIKGSATYRWHQGLYGVDGVANFMFVKHLIGDEQSSFASFQNASLSVRPFYKFRLLSYSTKAGGILKLNRNDYLNVSSGHTLTGVMAGSFIQAGSLRKVRLEGEFLYDVFPSFSFRKSGNYFDLDELANTNVDHYNLKVSH
jgi:hypothetical protein